jgi:hypothetical protein
MLVGVQDDPAFVWDAGGQRQPRARPARRPVRRDGDGPAPPMPPDHEETDAVLVPIDEWSRILRQLGNLHEAGQQLAEARERAAKAETESTFLRERLRETRGRVESLEQELDQPESEPEPMPTFGEWFVRRWLERKERD